MPGVRPQITRQPAAETLCTHPRGAPAALLVFVRAACDRALPCLQGAGSHRGLAAPASRHMRDQRRECEVLSAPLQLAHARDRPPASRSFLRCMWAAKRGRSAALPLPGCPEHTDAGARLLACRPADGLPGTPSSMTSCRWQLMLTACSAAASSPAGWSPAACACWHSAVAPDDGQGTAHRGYEPLMQMSNTHSGLAPDTRDRLSKGTRRGARCGVTSYCIKKAAGARGRSAHARDWRGRMPAGTCPCLWPRKTRPAVRSALFPTRQLGIMVRGVWRACLNAQPRRPCCPLVRLLARMTAHAMLQRCTGDTDA